MRRTLLALLLLAAPAAAQDLSGAGGVTANSCGAGQFASGIAANGTLTCTNDAVTSVGTLTGAVAMTGTANQVTVTCVAGACTFSTPQDIATTSAVRFGSLALAANEQVLSQFAAHRWKLDDTVGALSSFHLINPGTYASATQYESLYLGMNAGSYFIGSNCPGVGRTCRDINMALGTSDTMYWKFVASGASIGHLQSLGAGAVLDVGQGAVVAQSTGDIRGATTFTLAARNNANSADVTVLAKTTNDTVTVATQTAANTIATNNPASAAGIGTMTSVGRLASNYVAAAVNPGSAGASFVTPAGFSTTLKGGSLSAGKALRIRAWGSRAATANSTGVQALIGTTAVCTRDSMTSAAGVQWMLDCTVAYTGASAQVAKGCIEWGAVVSAVLDCPATTTPAENEANDLTVALQLHAATTTTDIGVSGWAVYFDN